jgi:hypothetical protein
MNDFQKHCYEVLSVKKPKPKKHKSPKQIFEIKKSKPKVNVVSKKGKQNNYRFDES